ncbi:MAG: cupin domain-containing protein [Patescibacteria group bacterium]
MKKTNVYELPLAANVCEQLLREIDRTPLWSMAHVLMNPRAWSLLHEHHLMDEIYLITRGTGHLIRGEEILIVQPGDAVHIRPYERHKLVNTSLTRLEHLVLAAPPFDPNDVHLDLAWKDPIVTPVPFVQPPVTDCFDGARIVAYEFPGIASVAFGSVLSDPERRKLPHYHKAATEWIFVIEGEGTLEVDGVPHLIGGGDWIRVDPGEAHAFRNEHAEHLVVTCICTPCFSMADVYYR